MNVLPKKNTSSYGGHITRGFLVAVLAGATVVAVFANGSKESAGNPIDQVLKDAVEQKKVPGVVAMVATADKIIYEGAAGKRNAGGNVPMTVDSIFRIASMTKPVTSVAVMQLVESGRIKLDEPAAKYLQELSKVQVLEEIDATGKAKLRPPKTPPTVRQLLSHTSGFGYEFFDARLHAYTASGAVPSAFQGGDGYLKAPLVFDPGTQWEYGISTDWLGKLVEAVSGQSLEEYCRRNIFGPLGMADTFFNVPEEKQARVVTLHQRTDEGTLSEVPPQPMKPVQFFSGGGGLHSTAGDYLKFARMMLGGGKLGNTRILKADSVGLMERNQIGDLSLVELRSMAPQFAKDPVQIPAAPDKFGLGFGINTKPVEGRRSTGTVSWAGIFNTYFWIDPSRKTCAVILMQMLPFGDDAAKAVLEQFERSVYATLPKN
jgi:methyl acetate hydrolase